jgi:hypothetical protein
MMKAALFLVLCSVMTLFVIANGSNVEIDPKFVFPDLKQLDAETQNILRDVMTVPDPSQIDDQASMRLLRTVEHAPLSNKELEDAWAYYEIRSEDQKEEQDNYDERMMARHCKDCEINEDLEPPAAAQAIKVWKGPPRGFVADRYEWPEYSPQDHVMTSETTEESSEVSEGEN